MTVLSGGCQCGAVRYRADVQENTAHLCHCRMCQKAAGNYFMPLANAPLATFELTRGALSHFNSSDLVRRGFCSNCGTPLTFETIEGVKHLNVTLGSLDDPERIFPVEQSGVESRVAWFDKLPKLFETQTMESEGDGGAKLAAIFASNHQHPDHDTKDWQAETGYSEHPNRMKS
jgi:hypothetical protein